MERSGPETSSPFPHHFRSKEVYIRELRTKETVSIAGGAKQTFSAQVTVLGRQCELM